MFPLDKKREKKYYNTTFDTCVLQKEWMELKYEYIEMLVCLDRRKFYTFRARQLKLSLFKWTQSM